MKFWKYSALVLGLGALAMALTNEYRATPASAQATNFTDEQVKSIQQIVKDYIIKNPEILQEAIVALQEKAEAEQAQKLSAQVPEFYKQFNKVRDDLKPFTVGTGNVTMIEFFDYNCGYCKKALPDVLKLAEDPSSNLKITFIEYPVIARVSRDASKVAVAVAKQGKYFEFHKKLLAVEDKVTVETALKVAESLGVDMAKLKSDMSAPETDAFLNKMLELGKNSYVEGTPTFFIGDKIAPGAVPIEMLKEMIAETQKSGCKACLTEADTKTEKKS